jgi:hypothetical protein
MTLGALAGSLNRRGLRRGLAVCRLHCIRPRRVTRLACDRGRISRLPAVVAGVLGTVVSTAFARSSVAPAVLRRAVVGRRSLSLGLTLASHDDVVLVSRFARFSAWLHRLLLQISCVQEFLDPGLLLPQVLALQSIQF